MRTQFLAICFRLGLPHQHCIQVWTVAGLERYQKLFWCARLQENFISLMRVDGVIYVPTSLLTEDFLHPFLRMVAILFDIVARNIADRSDQISHVKFVKGIDDDGRRRFGRRQGIRVFELMFEYVEMFHNRQRRHSSIGMLTPIEYEKIHHTKTA